MQEAEKTEESAAALGVSEATAIEGNNFQRCKVH
jgi:hypothetical protein